MNRIHHYIRYAALMLLFSGCSKEQPDENVPEIAQQPPPNQIQVDQTNEVKKSTLHILALEQLVEGEQAFLDDSIHAFTYRNPSVEIHFNALPPEKEPIDALSKMIENKQYPASILRVNRLMLYDISEQLNDRKWSKNHLVDFSHDPNVAGQHMDTVRDFWLQYNHTDNMVLGPTFDADYQCIWMNSDLADAIGYTPTQNGLFLTHPSLKDAVDKLLKWNEDQDEPIYLFSNNLHTYHGYTIFMHLLHALMTGPDGELIIENRERLNRSIKQVLNDIEALTPALRQNEQNVWEKEFVNEQLLFNVGRCSDYLYLCKEMGKEKVDRFQLFEGIVYDKPYKGLFGQYEMYYVVLKNAPNQTDAKAFMQFLSQPQQAQRWVRETMRMPGMKLKFFDPGFTKDVYGQFITALHEKSHVGRIYPMRIIRKNIEENQDRIIPIYTHQIHQEIGQLLTKKQTANQVYNSFMKLFDTVRPKE